MLRWIHFEFSKLRYYKTFWILVSLYLLMVLGSTKISNFSVNGAQAVSKPALIFWIVGFVSQMFLGYLTILLVCNEFENRTLRQHVINGLGRGEAVLSKLILLVLLSLAAIGMVTGMVAVITITSAGESLPIFELGFQSLNIFLRTFAYVSMAFLISVLFRSASSSMAVYISWTIFAEPLLGWLLKRQEIWLADWLPTEVFSKLLATPFHLTPAPTEAPSSGVYLATLGYIAVFWLLSLVKLERAAL